MKTFGLLPDRAWIWCDFPDFKHDYIKVVCWSDVCFAGRGPQTGDFHGDCLMDNQGFYWNTTVKNSTTEMCSDKIWKSTVKNIFFILFPTLACQSEVMPHGFQVFQWIYITMYFREWNRRMKSSTTWNGNAIAQSPRKFRDISNTNNMWIFMVYRMILDVILHLYFIYYDLWCQLPF